MNSTHLPRPLVILLFILVAVTFFAGTLRTFSQAQAASVLKNQAQKSDPPTTSGTLTPTPTPNAVFSPPGPTPTPLPTFLLPPPTESGPFMPTPPPTDTPAPTAIPTPISYTVYADTTGIIALAIVMVVVVLVGVTWGGRRPRQKKDSKK